LGTLSDLQFSRKIELATISGWEGSQAWNLCRLAAAKAVDDVGHDVIKLISSGSGRDAGGPGEAADEGGLFHGIFILRGVWLAIGDAEILEIDAGYCCEKGCSFEKKVTSLVTDFSTGAKIAFLR
jgi:hypothetical protein